MPLTPGGAIAEILRREILSILRLIIAGYETFIISGHALSDMHRCRRLLLYFREIFPPPPPARHARFSGHAMPSGTAFSFPRATARRLPLCDFRRVALHFIFHAK